MKAIKLLIILSAIITVGYFSWSFLNNRLFQDKHDRATLVLGNLYHQRHSYGRGYYD